MEEKGTTKKEIAIRDKVKQRERQDAKKIFVGAPSKRHVVMSGGF